MATIYEQTMALQNNLDSIPEKSTDKREIARIALHVINQYLHPSSRVAHASSAYFVFDGLTTESHLEHTQEFGEIILRGHVPRVDCVDVTRRLIVALPFFNAVVLGPSIEIETALVDHELDDCDAVLPLGVPLERPIYVPVESLESIILAA